KHRHTMLRAIRCSGQCSPGGPDEELLSPRRPKLPEINTGNTAWLLASSALVLLMTPGLALFYGGLNRSKGALNMMMMSFSSIGPISVLWGLYGFPLAFGTNDNAGVNNVLGNFSQYFGTGTTWIGEEWMV